MFNIRQSQKRLLRPWISAIVVAAVAVAPSATSAAALYPSTKIKVSVIQWMPTDGVYRAWEGLGGEFIVGRDGSVALPVVGAILASSMGSEDLAGEIANRLQAVTGLMVKPEVAVSVLDYPPVYVLGAVSKPGEYKFTEGLDILLAVAMGGGLLKEDTGRSKERLNITTSLRQIDAQLTMFQARIARLQAEFDHQPALIVPAEVQDAETVAIYTREQLIMSARAQEMSRQIASISELRELYDAEIGVSEQKRQATDAAIQTVEGQLKSMTTLVERGVVIATRQSDLERELARLRLDNLDQVTVTMKARQNISEATRNLEGLKDRQQTEITTLLQTEQAGLRDAMVRRDSEQKMLLKLLSDDAGRLSDSPEDVSYSISRMVDGGRTDIEGELTTTMFPGDVLTIKPREPQGKADKIASSQPVADPANVSR